MQVVVICVHVIYFVLNGVIRNDYYFLLLPPPSNNYYYLIVGIYI